MSTPTPRPSATPRRVVRVSKSTVAAARTQVNLAQKLGKPVPPAVAKIAQLWVADRV